MLRKKRDKESDVLMIMLTKERIWRPPAAAKEKEGVKTRRLLGAPASLSIVIRDSRVPLYRLTPGSILSILYQSLPG
jgi:hypothetical protein